MKFIYILLFFLVFSIPGYSQSEIKETPKPDPNKEVHIVEAGCGQCKLDLKGYGCDLAIRKDGKAYLVDGTSIDSHGDAHAKDGFCYTIRKAKVQGEVVDNRFKAIFFELLPIEEEQKVTK